MSSTIYYVYRKDTGEFAGSGTPFFDDEEHGCTEIAAPSYDSETQKLFWLFDTETWEVRDLPVSEAEELDAEEDMG